MGRSQRGERVIVSDSPRRGRSSLAEAFRDKSVLVTGHTGFKGAWLSSWLLGLGARVAGFALSPPTEPSLFDKLGLDRCMAHRIGDVRDLEAVGQRVDEVEPEVVFHLAAQSIVRVSYSEPIETFATNVLGTAHVLEAIRQRGRPCVVLIVTSDKCYENREQKVALAEDDPLGGRDPYSASKGAAEIVTAAYRRSFFPLGQYEAHGVAVASARAGNVIGGGDWATDRLVPDIVRAVAEGQPPELRHPEAVRPWQHVLDALAGYLRLAQLMLDDGPSGLAEAWNFGPLDDPAEPVLTVGELTDRILDRWTDGSRMTWAAAPQPAAPHEARYLRLDARKAVARLGWRPVWNVERTVDETVRWYREDHERGDMASFTAAQIRDYCASAQRSGLGWVTGPERRRAR
ncbi:MAG: CDP-glucose 4,6-dehydratase [Acidobacteriota bacterium]|nr:MAG: CDP-glucose 4,6-dehydratase [Acidobacteriota bacterium]